MRGRCLGAIVDQLVLGRFLADRGRFLINFRNIGPKRKCEEIHAEIHDFGPKSTKIVPWNAPKTSLEASRFLNGFRGVPTPHF